MKAINTKINSNINILYMKLQSYTSENLEITLFHKLYFTLEHLLYEKLCIIKNMDEL